MKEFSLELAKQGYPVCTRDGRKVRILCYDALTVDDMPPNPIVALVLEGEGNEGENVYRYPENGKYYYEENTPSDLMMAPVRHEGWVNIYRDGGWFGTSVKVYQTKEGAIKEAVNDKTYIGTTKIEWEE